MSGSQIPLQVTDNYSPFFIVGLQYRQHIKEHLAIGGHVEFKSTGGRLHYADYSGEAYVNLKVNSVVVSFTATQYLTIESTYGFYLYLYPGVSFSSLDITSGITLGGQTEEESQGFNSTSFSIEPGIGYERYFSNFIASIDIGYEYVTKGKLYVNGSDAFIINGAGDPIGAEWNGLRLRLGIGYKF